MPSCLISDLSEVMIHKKTFKISLATQPHGEHEHLHTKPLKKEMLSTKRNMFELFGG
jgi:hypothetical protein